MGQNAHEYDKEEAARRMNEVLKRADMPLNPHKPIKKIKKPEKKQ